MFVLAIALWQLSEGLPGIWAVEKNIKKTECLVLKQGRQAGKLGYAFVDRKGMNYSVHMPIYRPRLALPFFSVIYC